MGYRLSSVKQRATSVFVSQDTCEHQSAAAPLRHATPAKRNDRPLAFEHARVVSSATSVNATPPNKVDQFEDSRAKRRRWYAYLKEHHRKIFRWKVGTDVPDTTPPIWTALPEEQRPSAERIRTATEALQERRQRTAWKKLEPEVATISSIFGAVVQKEVSRKWPGVEVEVAASSEAKYRPLLFAPAYRLLSIPKATDGGDFRYIFSPDADARSTEPIPLNGESARIHDWNEGRAEKINLSEPLEAEDYLRFFCNHLKGDDGYFLIVESIDEIILEPAEDAVQDKNPSNGSGQFSVPEPILHFLDPSEKFKKFNESFGKYIIPITRVSASDNNNRSADTLRFCVTLFYKQFIHAILELNNDGTVEMLEDCPITPADPYYDPTKLPLRPTRQ